MEVKEQHISFWRVQPWHNRPGYFEKEANDFAYNSAGAIFLHSKFIHKCLLHGMTCSTNYGSLKASPVIWLFFVMENNLALSYEKYVSVWKSYFVRLPFIA